MAATFLLLATNALLTPFATRRSALATAAVAAAPPALKPAAAAEATATRTVGSVLEATVGVPVDSERLPISLALRPEYGLESSDVMYPSWALGRWTASSTLRSVFAPAGEALFSPGRNGTEALRRARLEVGAPLDYEVRWRRPENDVIVDREFNVASISRATMGANAVQNAQEDGPDHLTIVLRPNGAPGTSLFSADLRVVSRRTDPYPLAPRPNYFACAETTRQQVTTVAGEKAAAGPPRSPLIKEIETICTYELDAANPAVMRGHQRTATFLVPDATYTGDASLVEQAASRLARAPDGRLVALDVRLYELEYRRTT